MPPGPVKARFGPDMHSIAPDKTPQPQDPHQSGMSSSYNSVYDGDTAGYARLRSCWLNRRREEFIAARIVEYALPAGSLAVEIGSGTGGLLNRLGRRFPDLRFLGIEPLAGYVDFARTGAPSNVSYVTATAEDAGPLLPGPPRLVLSNDVLHHLPSYSTAARGLARHAAAGCLWLALEPNQWNPYTFLRQSAGYGERNFHPRAFAQAAGREGWRLGSREYLFLIPPFVKQAPAWMKAMERRFERVPMLAGGVCLEFSLALPSSPDCVRIVAL